MQTDARPTTTHGGHSAVAPLRRVAVKRPADAWTEQSIEADWEKLEFLGRPDLSRAVDEHDRLVAILRDAGAEVLFLPRDYSTTIDSIYAHDAVLVTDAGIVTLRTGKANRRSEADAIARCASDWGVPVLGAIEAPATAEAGDMLWVDAGTLAVGRGFRTNSSGIASLRALLAPLGVDVCEIHLPYDNGPSDCLHLLSVVSMLADDLAIVYRKLLPVPMYELLFDRDVALVDVEESEYATLGCNVLALAPRDVVIADGNPVTAARLQDAGCRVRTFPATEIGVKGCGGPTCLTRPIRRG